VSRAVLQRVAAATAVCLGVPLGYLVLAVCAAVLVPAPMTAALVADGVTAVVAGLVIARMSLEGRRHQGAPARQPARVAALAGVVGLTVVTGQSASLMVHRVVGSRGWQEHVAAQSQAPLALTLVFTLLVAPVTEELMLRGLMFPLLRRQVSLATSVVLTTLVFAVLHGNLVQSLAVLPLGVVLALMREMTDRVWPGIVAHFGFNLTALVIPATAIAAMAAHPFVVVVLMAGLTVAMTATWTRWPAAATV
jgi:membrane protease YdiL (CAAX protease family)